MTIMVVFLCDHHCSLSKSARIMAYFSLEATTQRKAVWNTSDWVQKMLWEADPVEHSELWETRQRRSENIPTRAMHRSHWPFTSKTVVEPDFARWDYWKDGKIHGRLTFLLYYSIITSLPKYMLKNDAFREIRFKFPLWLNPNFFEYFWITSRSFKVGNYF